MDSWSLLKFNQYIKQKLKETIPGSYWVVGEINELNINSSGHCYMELIEKAPDSGQIVARNRATIWAYYFRMLYPYFETMTGRKLTTGLKVMLLVTVEFHELYGISLQVTDINPAYTVGDLLMQKQAVIRQLTEEGVIDMNRELEVPQLPQRIAVISSETAAGYGDFIDQLHNNIYGYAFRHTLFQAVMQGNDAESSIIGALERIFEQEDEFDVVVMIRGGGSQTDLNCFNSYELTCCMAQFPLPILTGIGHDRDETIADRVACIPLKTPTAVAEFLINKAVLVDQHLQELGRRLAGIVELSLQVPADQLKELSQKLKSVVQTRIHIKDKELQACRLRLSHTLSAFLTQQKFVNNRLSSALQVSTGKAIREQSLRIPDLLKRLEKTGKQSLDAKQKQLEWLENKLQWVNPDQLLQRGYSITLSGGKAVQNIRDLKPGQPLETIFYDGKVESTVEKIISDK